MTGGAAHPGEFHSVLSSLTVAHAKGCSSNSHLKVGTAGSLHTHSSLFNYKGLHNPTLPCALQDQLREVEEAKNISEARLQAQLQTAAAEAVAVRADLTERIRGLLAESSGLEVSLACHRGCHITSLSTLAQKAISAVRTLLTQ